MASIDNMPHTERVSPSSSFSVNRPLDPGLPLSHPTESPWLIPPDPLQKYRSSETLPKDTLDVVIIGSGFSGTSVAWHLLHDSHPNPPLSVLMLEARDTCSGATGRNGGHLSCDFYSYFSSVERQYDAEEAVRQSIFQKLNFDAVREVIRCQNIDCELNWGPSGCDVCLTDAEFQWSKRELEGMSNAGGYVSTMKVLEGAAAAKVKQCSGAILIQEQASMKPYALVTSLLRILIKRHSLQLHTNTPVTSITSPSQTESFYTINTPRGSVRTTHVINATNAWVSHLYPEFEGKIFPTRGQVVEIEAKNLKLGPMGWNYGAEYLIQRPDSSLILGGGRRFAEGAEIGNFDDTTINLEVSQFLHAFLPSQFALAESPITSKYEWTGIMGFSHDSHPYVGHSEHEPNKWVIAGFEGLGMVRIWLCAKALVEQLRAAYAGQSKPWPNWMPKAYIYHPSRQTIDRLERPAFRSR